MSEEKNIQKVMPRGFAAVIQKRGRSRGFYWAVSYIYQVRCGYRHNPEISAELLLLAESHHLQRKQEALRIAAILRPVETPAP
jgi:hypothetical protein